MQKNKRNSQRHPDRGTVTADGSPTREIDLEMTDTILSSATREVAIGFGRPFVMIGERINLSLIHI